MASTLLAVDDSVTMRKVLEITFAGPDFRVVTANSPDAAMQKLKGDKPDLVIALQGSLETCMKRIKKAGRAFEKGITPEYVSQLIEAYNYYFYHYEETPLLVVDTNEIDFVNRPTDFEDLVGQIQKARKGVQYYVPAGSPR